VVRCRLQDHVLAAVRIEVDMHGEGQLSDVEVAFVIKPVVTCSKVNHGVGVLGEP